MRVESFGEHNVLARRPVEQPFAYVAKTDVLCMTLTHAHLVDILEHCNRHTRRHFTNALFREGQSKLTEAQLTAQRLRRTADSNDTLDTNATSDALDAGGGRKSAGLRSPHTPVPAPAIDATTAAAAAAAAIFAAAIAPFVAGTGVPPNGLLFTEPSRSLRFRDRSKPGPFQPRQIL